MENWLDLIAVDWGLEDWFQNFERAGIALAVVVALALDNRHFGYHQSWQPLCYAVSFSNVSTGAVII